MGSNTLLLTSSLRLTTGRAPVLVTRIMQKFCRDNLSPQAYAEKELMPGKMNSYGKTCMCGQQIKAKLLLGEPTACLVV